MLLRNLLLLLVTSVYTVFCTKGQNGRGLSPEDWLHSYDDDPVLQNAATDQVQKRSSSRCTFRERFRKIDGSCNHKHNLGQAFGALSRLYPPVYQDGLQQPRVFSVTGVPLPNPRAVSLAIHFDRELPSDTSLYLMQWGQFLDHDFAETPLPEVPSADECCGPSRSDPAPPVNSECISILFGSDAVLEGSCMPQVRSLPFVDENGDIVYPRVPINAVTSFIDGSQVYGSEVEVLEKLLDPEHPKLLKTTAGDFLPDSGKDNCVLSGPADHCFLAGDNRVNEQPGLSAMHTFFVRYHNALAKELFATPRRSSERLVFQEARAIVGAVMQVITYGDWLPHIVGPTVRAKYGLNLGRAVRYDPHTDPSLFNSFASAVFRFGHSLIAPVVPISTTETELLGDVFDSPMVTRNNLDGLAAGYSFSTNSNGRSQPADQILTSEVTNRLFANSGPAFDLAALSIGRGREHGIPCYNYFRTLLFNDFSTSIAELPVVNPSDFMIYADVSDIDLFPGGMAEPPHDNGLLGETFSHLLAIQFSRLRKGDRFFFDRPRLGTRFSPRQIRLLKTISLAHVICMTTNVEELPRDIFKIPSSSNPNVDCDILRSEHPRAEQLIGFSFASSMSRFFPFL